MQSASRLVEFDGFPLRLRRVPMELWVQHQRVPQFISTMVLRMMSGDADGVGRAAAALSDEEAMNYLKFRRAVVEYSAVEPRIVFDERELGEDEISAEEMMSASPGLLDFIFNWACGVAADSPVMTEESEVSAGALHSFRGDETGHSEPAGIVVHGADVSDAAIGVAATV